MTEKEKCHAGMLYDAIDPELMNDRMICKDLCQNYNQLTYSQNQEKQELIKKIIGDCGEDFVIEPNFWCDYGYNIFFGNQFYANHNLVILDCAEVRFGDHVFIGPNCNFYTAGHPLDAETRNLGLEFAKPILVGNNVWFGGNVTVLPGITIGNNAVIGAGSVVTKDIPAFAAAVGNPCQVIKMLE
ncbi:maltose acetyltransferase [Chryseobacterium sp. Leaf180]|uniref:sugar O-acetyltransferase n=1 Tax=Chryseobacterium sp. Leaf180 TaxID=1736289 RepID=UPI0006FA5834|nr:sugar O-acetyltransferase [Chryseobacterium sp. Leaf180]KQR94718.1 maltose acetyltransferase [Chryseobacterium sp. Leaf180]